MSNDSAGFPRVEWDNQCQGSMGTILQGGDTSDCFHRYCCKVQRSELRAVQSPRGSELAHPFPSENTPVTGHSPVQQWDSVCLPEGKTLASWECARLGGGGSISMAKKANFCKEIPDYWVRTRDFPVMMARATPPRYVSKYNSRSRAVLRVNRESLKIEREMGVAT